ncbi:MAG: enoyl-CoA hydratase-related protein [Devosia sp.]
MNLEYVQVIRDGAITTITLNRPECLNALHIPAHRELAEIFDAYFADSSQRVAILTGSGARAFCAGNDLKYQAVNGALQRPPAGFGGLASRFDRDKPVIAAVNGIAAGGGFELALACDLVIAAQTASFSLPEPKVGLAALAGGLLRLPRQVGLKHAMGVILTGRSVGAEEGLRMGFVNEVVQPSDVVLCARSWALQILQCSPASITASMQAMRRGMEVPDLEAAMLAHIDVQAVQELRNSADFLEGPRAFSEKRKPRWTT